MDPTERIETLESELREQQEGSQAIKTTLDRILAQLNNLDLSGRQSQTQVLPPPGTPDPPDDYCAPSDGT